MNIRSFLDRRFLIVLAICLAAAAVAGQSRWLRHLDDLMLDGFSNIAPMPIDDDLLIVSIDQRSIDALGRWPWPRALQARLLDSLTDYATRLVVYDIMLSEKDHEHPEHDELLATAIQKHGRVVLPVQPVGGPVPGSVRVLSPLPLFARAAHALGADDIEVDRDGLVRRYFLENGVSTRMWPALGVLLADSDDIHAGQRVTAYSSRAALHWLRNDEILLRFAGPAGVLPAISAVDIIEGRAPRQALAGKKVIVGAMDASLGSEFAVPISEENRLMSGVEIQAQAANTILHPPLMTILRGPACLIIELLLGLCVATLLWAMRDRSIAVGVTVSLFFLVLAWMSLLLAFHAWMPVVTLLLATLIAGMYLESARAKGFRHDARTDRLTQLHNRRSFDMEFDNRWRRHARNGGRLSLALVDIDFFKAYNDGYGHAAGDRVLATVASILKRCVGTRGTVSRFGGEEFAVLIPDLWASSAHEVVEEIRYAIEAHGIAHEHASGRDIVTVSIGVATVVDGQLTSAGKLFEHADKALYEAKRKGRNRVEIAIVAARPTSTSIAANPMP
ncbi:MAG TPA: diguanylate cyclase [Chromatiaceae bacterium]|nr:diguanylate cyclase [Chromatiaceae bacterium]